MKRTTRRQFLLHSAATAGFAFGGNRAFGQMIGVDAPFNDYRAIVCLFLSGGNDSFNMVMPRSGAEYDAYAASRQNLALARESLLPISPNGERSSAYGMHPQMPELAQLFEEGRAAFIVNVGPLIQPTTKDQYKGKEVELPPQLFSHNDQQNQWQTLRGLSRTRSGWAGRIADLIRTNVSEQRLTTNVSLSGISTLQAADESPAYTMGHNGPVDFVGFGHPVQGAMRREALQRLNSEHYDSIYAQAFADVQLRAMQAAGRIQTALEAAPPLSAAFPGTPLGEQLETIARLIAVAERLDMKRQIFFASAGGFDTHDRQLTLQPELLAGLSAAVSAFHHATVELGVAQSVTLFTQSDFGRTLTSNGDGTDHGWGGVQIVIGDAVRGRQIYGAYPLLEVDGPDDLGGGRIVPTVSADQYAATLARWFGIDDADLEIVAPHLANFVQRDLGFLM